MRLAPLVHPKQIIETYVTSVTSTIITTTTNLVRHKTAFLSMIRRFVHLFKASARNLVRLYDEFPYLLGYQYAIFGYYPKTKTILHELFNHYGSDKGSLEIQNSSNLWISHTYADIYHQLFQHCRDSIKIVIECGIGTNNPLLVSSMGNGASPGASLRAWKDYFPNALIVGLDIDRNILFKEDRISTFYCDQTKQTDFAEVFKSLGLSSFDLMIDDGLHTSQAAIKLFNSAKAYMTETSIYVIEDMDSKDLPTLLSYLETEPAYYFMCLRLSRPNHRIYDNTMVVIRKK